MTGSYASAASHRAAIVWLLMVAVASPASAQLSKKQQRCVNGLNKALLKVSARVAAQSSTCLRRIARGAALDPADPEIDTLEECLAADPKGKIAAATRRTTAHFDNRCTPPPVGKLDEPFPLFAATDAPTINSEALRAVPDLFEDVFGSDPDAAVVTGDASARKCQLTTWKAAVACQAARLKELAGCERRALKGAGTSAPVASKVELRDHCLGDGASGQPDPKGRIAARCAKEGGGIHKKLGRKCVGQDLAERFPGCVDAEDIGECLGQRAACRACLAGSQANDLDRRCDLFDDGVANESCSLGLTEIACESPGDAMMVQLAAGGDVDFSGTVRHPSGIAALEVDGTPVDVAADGSFHVPLATRYGINLVDLVATNDLGEERATTCSFLAADRFHGEDAFLDDGAGLVLRQQAVDDVARAGPIGSLGDVLHTVLNSSGLRNTLHAELLAANPLEASTCHESVLGVCVLRSEVIYLDSSLPGPNTAGLALVDDGVHSSGRVEDLAIRVRVRGQVAGIPYDTSGWVTFDFGEVALTSDVQLVGGAPRASVRSGTVSSSVGSISTSFSGLDGAILNVVVSLFNATVRDLVTGVIREYVANNFNDVLDGLLASLEGSASSSFAVPRLGGAGAIPIDLTARGSSLSVTPARIFYGVGTLATVPAGQTLPSLGVALPAGVVGEEPLAIGGVGASSHVAVLNQVLHALWRGGWLEMQLDAGLLAGAPAGTTASLLALLPPVAAVGASGTLEVGLGGLQVDLTLPGLFDEPARLMIGARAHSGLIVAGGDIGLAPMVVDDLRIAAVNRSLDVVTRSGLEALLQSLVQSVLDEVLASAAPALPVPTFEIDPALGVFGLPIGAQLGITNPVVGTSATHIELRGAFGIL